MAASYGRIRANADSRLLELDKNIMSDGINVSFDAYYDIYQLHNIIRKIVRGRIKRFKRRRYSDDRYHNYVVSGKELSDFLSDSKFILRQIDLMGPIVIVRGLINVHCSNKELKRLLLMCQYMEVCKNYVSLSYTCNIEIPKVEYCRQCAKSFNDAVAKNDVCWRCSCGYVSYYHRSKGNDVEVGSEYDPRVTFIKECIYFQGKEDESLPADLFDRLDKFFLENNGMVRSEVLTRPRDEYGKTKGTSLELLNCGLRSCGYSSLYKRANRIGRDYWGWKLFDLQPYMTTIMHFYELYLAAYNTINDRTRKSNISLQSTLLRILDLVGIPVRDSDFKLCTTVQSIETCEQLWFRVCQISGMTYKRRF